MNGKPATEVGRLIASVIWHLDRAVIEKETWGNLLEAQRHRDVAHELATRIRTIDSSSKTEDVIRDLMK
jgi:hypothetical protein